MLRLGIEVVADGDATSFGRRFQKGFRDGADLIVGVSADSNGSARAVICSLAVFVVFELLEVGKDLFEAPTIAAARSLSVVVRVVAA